jgi:hypothetical protein
MSAPPLGVDPRTKIGRVLAALATGRTLHRFQAERELADHVLPTTIATLQKRFALRIDRRTIEVPGYLGHRTHVAEYQLPSDQLEQARGLIRHAT